MQGVTGSNAALLDKRGCILAAATQVFLRAGYHGASMDVVARTAGVSKQTVYNHFGCKATLFEAIVADRVDVMLESLGTATPSSQDPVVVLTAIAERLLDAVLSEEALARFRLVVSESGRHPELAEAFYRSGPMKVTAKLASCLAELEQAGYLSVPEPWEAAAQFFAMVRGDVFLRALLRIGTPPGAKQRRQYAETIVEQFLSSFCGRHSSSCGSTSMPEQRKISD